MSDFPDPYEELARELRLGPGRDMQREAELTELETHIARLRRRTLAELAIEAMHRGDTITVTLAGRSITGTPAFVGTDYMVLETPTEVVDVRLDRVILTVVRRPRGGHRVQGGSRTMKARLAEYEQTGEPVRVVCDTAGEEISGRIRIAASDHLLVDTSDGQRVVPIAAVGLVVRNRPDDRP